MSAINYRKKPIVIEAIQWTGHNLKDVQAFAGRMENMDGDAEGPRFFEPFAVDDDGLAIFKSANAHLWVEANTSWLPIEDGEWIIRDELGLYPCKPAIFAANYEAS